MNSATIRAAVVALCVSGLMAALSAPASAQAGAAIHVYSGEMLQGSGVDALAWGSGEVRESEDESFAGVKSLQVTTHGATQGLRLVLKAPADLSAAAADPSIYFRVGVKITDTVGNTASTGTYGTFGGGGRAGVGGFGGRGGAGGLGGRGRGDDYDGGGASFGGSRGGASGRSGGSGARTGGASGRTGGGLAGGGRSGSGQYGRSSDQLIGYARPMTAVRAVFVFTDGKQCEARLPLANASSQRNEWKVVSVPTGKIAGLTATNMQLKEVRIFGDSIGTIYVGDVSTVHDITPITVGDLPEQTVAVNDIVTFSASADGGNTQLKYEWTVTRTDAGTPTGLAAGVADLEGRSVRYFFRKSGDYTITLKVSDMDGVKKPATTQGKVTVTL